MTSLMLPYTLVYFRFQINIADKILFLFALLPLSLIAHNDPTTYNHPTDTFCCLFFSIILAGIPTAVEYGGTSCNTTALAPTETWLPILASTQHPEFKLTLSPITNPALLPTDTFWNILKFFPISTSPITIPTE